MSVKQLAPIGNVAMFGILCQSVLTKTTMRHFVISFGCTTSRILQTRKDGIELFGVCCARHHKVTRSEAWRTSMQGSCAPRSRTRRPSTGLPCMLHGSLMDSRERSLCSLMLGTTRCFTCQSTQTKQKASLGRTDKSNRISPATTEHDGALSLCEKFPRPWETCD